MEGCPIAKNMREEHYLVCKAPEEKTWKVMLQQWQICEEYERNHDHEKRSYHENDKLELSMGNPSVKSWSKQRINQFGRGDKNLIIRNVPQWHHEGLKRVKSNTSWKRKLANPDLHTNKIHA